MAHGAVPSLSQGDERGLGKTSADEPGPAGADRASGKAEGHGDGKSARKGGCRRAPTRTETKGLANRARRARGTVLGSVRGFDSARGVVDRCGPANRAADVVFLPEKGVLTRGCQGGSGKRGPLAGSFGCGRRGGQGKDRRARAIRPGAGKATLIGPVRRGRGGRRDGTGRLWMGVVGGAGLCRSKDDVVAARRLREGRCHDGPHEECGEHSCGQTNRPFRSKRLHRSLSAKEVRAVLGDEPRDRAQCHGCPCISNRRVGRTQAKNGPFPADRGIVRFLLAPRACAALLFFLHLFFEPE
jgi:hypothetical protein